MSRAKVLTAGVAALTLALGGCGTVNVKPSAGSGGAASRGRVDSAATTKPNHVQCLRAAGLPVQENGTNGLTVGVAPAAVRVQFEPTPGVAQGDQIQGGDVGAEVIGSALVYPGAASDGELSTIERCLAKGVKG